LAGVAASVCVSIATTVPVATKFVETTPQTALVAQAVHVQM
jgi:hypothetical protein